MKKDLPIYNIVMDDETEGLNFVSFVADPAILEMGLAFSNKPQASFKFNKDKQVVIGPAMIADLPLYREIDGEGFYVVFTKEVIEKLVEKFNRDSVSKKINVDHADVVDSAFIKSNWIKEDMKHDKSLMYGFENIPVGSWFVEVKVDDAEFWENEIKSGGKFGFSVEGIFGLDYKEFNKNKNDEMKLSKEELDLINKYRADLKLAEVKDEEEEIIVEAVEDEEIVKEEEDSIKKDEEVINEVKDEEEIEVKGEEEIEVEVDPLLDAEAILAIVQPKMDELLDMIAELKSKMEEGDVLESDDVVVEEGFDRKTAYIKAFRTKFSA